MLMATRTSSLHWNSSKLYALLILVSCFCCQKRWTATKYRTLNIHWKSVKFTLMWQQTASFRRIQLSRPTGVRCKNDCLSCTCPIIHCSSCVVCICWPLLGVHFWSLVQFCRLFFRACWQIVCVLIDQHFTIALCRENDWFYCSVECWLLTVLKVGFVMYCVCLSGIENRFTEWFTLNNKTSHSPLCTAVWPHKHLLATVWRKNI